MPGSTASSIGKAEAARIVFGEALVGGGDNHDDDEGVGIDDTSAASSAAAAGVAEVDSSLVYSVTPGNRKKPSLFSAALPPSPQHSQQQQQSFNSSSNRGASMSALGSGSSGGGGGAHVKKAANKNSINNGNSSTRKKKAVSMGPFDQIIASAAAERGGGKDGAATAKSDSDDGGKENSTIPSGTEDVNSRTISSSNNDGAAKSKGDSSSSSSAAVARQNHQHQNRRRPERSQAAQQQRRILSKQAQLAIDKASASVNPSLSRAIQAKGENERYKSRQASQFKSELRQEREAALAFHQRSGESRMKLLHLKRELSSKAGQQKARLQQQRKDEELAAIDRESHFKSGVYRDHQETLRAQEANRRRMSVEARAKLRQNHRAGEQRLQMQRIEEDQAVVEERHEASLAKREFDRELAERRRKSFAFRSGDARRIRELHAAMESQREREEHESYELKWQGERDAERYRRQLEEQRRQSLAGRGQAIVKQRELGRAREDEELAAEHESYELKWAGEKDAEAYARKMEQQRRESLAMRGKAVVKRREIEAEQDSEEMIAERESYSLKFAAERDADAYKRRMEEERRASLQARNLQARKQRRQQEQEEAEARDAEHRSYELKWDGEKDAEAYKREMERQRRESTAGRNQERAKHAKVMDELKMIAREQETESLVLKWAGEEDAKAYLRKLEEERRQSLKMRGRQVLHHRQVESELKDEELQRAHEDEELRSADQKDVEAYREKCAERDRTSLQYRRKEAHVKRLEEMERQKEQQRVDSSNFELETLARTDVEEYIQGCKQRRRMSLAFRASEKRRHNDWRRKQAEEERAARSRDVSARMMDMRYAEFARHQERAQEALDAIRHAGCSFNPFKGVL